MADEDLEAAIDAKDLSKDEISKAALSAVDKSSSVDMDVSIAEHMEGNVLDTISTSNDPEQEEAMNLLKNALGAKSNKIGSIQITV